MFSNETPVSRPWQRLQDGNLRWIEDGSTAGSDRGSVRRAETRDSQTPFAMVLGCSDSRVPAEILFDQGIGDLFVVRTAGHVVDAAALGSIEYAIEMLHVELIVVLGHEGCGAVAAATSTLDGAEAPPGYIRDLVERIAPNVMRARRAGATTLAEIGGQHSLLTLDLLRQRSTIVENAVTYGAVEVVPAQYSLSTGMVAEVYPLTRSAETVSPHHVLAAV